jgi:hypothetical protein
LRLLRQGFFRLEFLCPMGTLSARSKSRRRSSADLERESDMTRIDPLDSPEPPLRTRPRPSLFFIGQDSRGNWVVRDQAGLRGGLFVNRSEALRFAMLESGRHPRAVIMVPGVLFKAAVKDAKGFCQTKLEPAAEVVPHDLVAGEPRERAFMVAAQG